MGFSRPRTLEVVPIRTHEFEQPACKVFGGWVDHCFHIRKRNLVEKLGVIVGVERSPTTVAALHSQGPFQAVRDGSLFGAGVFRGNSLKLHEDNCRIVHVGVPVVGELEGPTSWVEVGVVHAPVSPAENLILDEPGCRAIEGGMVGLQAGVQKRFCG
ncbi:hypothetical protein HRbin30_02359 [bacterium HR30]|nr:hypothetical protein HRbin30_02359 [bacterium HR30]